MQKLLLHSIVLLGLAACSPTRTSKTTSGDPFFPSSRMFTALFIQRADEYKALCFQAYNMATWRLQQKLENGQYTKPLAVVTDIDETILDNTPNAVHQATKGLDYDPAAWERWTALAKADTLCGAVTFFKFAASKDVEVFYVTNRNESERAATLKNLQRFGFPYADDAHLLLKTNTSGKEPRREFISQTHEILMLCGDNLSDFSTIFDKNTETARTQNTINNAALFGDTFIVLPNPNYGDWESVLYDYNYNRSPQEKKVIIQKKLKTY